jgi:hypothetical protein
MTLTEAKAFTTWGFRWACWLYLAVWLIGLLWPTDNSDINRFHRSEMAIRTDALTGCQYLESHGGGLIARLDGTGNIIGCRMTR